MVADDGFQGFHHGSPLGEAALADVGFAGKVDGCFRKGNGVDQSGTPVFDDRREAAGGWT
ncbi:MAG: hypothetical protein MZV49_25575 [Rhodopseudomonas palustris]|nr:hypothetical protein [Rhodopseudomonas palustris]